MKQNDQNDKKNLGDRGEKLAIKFLKKLDLKILAHNYYCRYGELDIVAIDDDTLVFAEVKTRKTNVEKALNSISISKQKKIIKSAKVFLNKNPRYDNYPTRFDVIAVIKTGNKWKIKHLKEAFLPEL